MTTPHAIIADALRPLTHVAAAPSLEAFRKTALAALMEMCGARTAALYGFDETGEHLVPLACSDDVHDAPTVPLSAENGMAQALLYPLRSRRIETAHRGGAGGLRRFVENLFARPAPGFVALPCWTQEQTGQMLFFALVENRAEVDLAQRNGGLLGGEIIASLLRLHLRLSVYEYQNRQLDRSNTVLNKANSELNLALPGALANTIIGKSAQMKRIRQRLVRAAATAMNVLILGETGTGKELAARAIHTLSARREAPLVVENVSALPETLLESELFGHEKGAFTGADRKRQGLFVRAHGGTLFLDEIGDMPLASQSSLLRVIEDGVVRPLGGRAARATDFRLVTATHKDLAQAVRAGDFRSDLFYRLNQVVIALPPLRERRDDIVVLAEHFAREIAEREEKAIRQFSRPAVRYLLQYHFPGNVRELRSVIERVHMIAADTGVIEADAVRDAIESDTANLHPPAHAIVSDIRLSDGVGLKEAREMFEREYIRQCHQRNRGDRLAMATELQIPKRTLADKIRKYEISDVIQ